MPWNDNSNGGGGGGPWGSSGGGNNNNNNPWGNGQRKPGGGRPGGQEPDLEDLLRSLNNFFGGIFGGGKGGKSGSKGPGGSFLGLIITGALALWLLIPGSGWYVVEPNEAGVVLRFGEYNRTTTPGFKLKLPIPFETVELPEVTTTQEIQVGTEQRGVNMLTQDENIVDLSFVVQWRVDVSDEGVRNYLFNVRSVEQTIQAVAESAMREAVGTTELIPLIGDGRFTASDRARDLMQATLNEYQAGVTILDVNMSRSQAPEEVIDAFRDVDAAEQDRERLQLNATAYANRVIPEARGDAARLLQQAEAYRDSVIAEAQGQADRFNAIYDEYRQAPEVTRRRMYLETMEQVLGRSDLIILDEQGGAIPYLPLDQLGRNRSAAPQRDDTTAGGQQ